LLKAKAFTSSTKLILDGSAVVRLQASTRLALQKKKSVCKGGDP
jgi:hypothetical protein